MRRYALILLCCLCFFMSAARAQTADKLLIDGSMGTVDLTPYKDVSTLIAITLDGGGVTNAQALSGQKAKPRVTLKSADAASAAALLTALKGDYFELSIQDMALEGELLAALKGCGRLNWLELKHVTLESFTALKGLKTVTDVILDSCEIADMVSIKVLGTYKFPRYFTLTIKRFPEGTDYTGLYGFTSELDFVTVIGYEEDAPFDIDRVKARNVRYIRVEKVEE